MALSLHRRRVPGRKSWRWLLLSPLLALFVGRRSDSSVSGTPLARGAPFVAGTPALTLAPLAILPTLIGVVALVGVIVALPFLPSVPPGSTTQPRQVVAAGPPPALLASLPYIPGAYQGNNFTLNAAFLKSRSLSLIPMGGNQQVGPLVAQVRGPVLSSSPQQIISVIVPLPLPATSCSTPVSNVIAQGTHTIDTLAGTVDIPILGKVVTGLSQTVQGVTHLLGDTVTRTLPQLVSGVVGVVHTLTQKPLNAVPTTLRLVKGTLITLLPTTSKVVKTTLSTVKSTTGKVVKTTLGTVKSTTSKAVKTTLNTVKSTASKTVNTTLNTVKSTTGNAVNSTLSTVQSTTSSAQSPVAKLPVKTAQANAKSVQAPLQRHLKTVLSLNKILRPSIKSHQKTMNTATKALQPIVKSTPGSSKIIAKPSIKTSQSKLHTVSKQQTSMQKAVKTLGKTQKVTQKLTSTVSNLSNATGIL